MPKLKTRKAVLKRFKITGSGKVKRRRTGQNHFNARDFSKKTRAKRNDHIVAPTQAKNILIDLAQ